MGRFSLCLVICALMGSSSAFSSSELKTLKAIELIRKSNSKLILETAVHQGPKKEVEWENPNFIEDNQIGLSVGNATVAAGAGLVNLAVIEEYFPRNWKNPNMYGFKHWNKSAYRALWATTFIGGVSTVYYFSAVTGKNLGLTDYDGHSLVQNGTAQTVFSAILTGTNATQAWMIYRYFGAHPNPLSSFFRAASYGPGIAAALLGAQTGHRISAGNPTKPKKVAALDPSFFQDQDLERKLLNHEADRLAYLFGKDKDPLAYSRIKEMWRERRAKGIEKDLMEDLEGLTDEMGEAIVDPDSVLAFAEVSERAEKILPILWEVAGQMDPEEISPESVLKAELALQGAQIADLRDIQKRNPRPRISRVLKEASLERSQALLLTGAI